VLTGTPMENSVRDLWSIMKLRACPVISGNRNDFPRALRTADRARPPRPMWNGRLSRRLQPFLLPPAETRRSRKICPRKIEQVVPLPA